MKMIDKEVKAGTAPRYFYSFEDYIEIYPEGGILMVVKRSASIVLIVAALLVFAAGVAPAQLLGTVKDVEQPVGSTGKVDWTTGVITAVGIGAPPEQTANAAQARAMAA